MMSSSKPPSKTDFKQFGTSKKIESPFAKYNSTGQLTCIICNQVVKSELVWNAHVNSRSHLENKNKLKSKLTDTGGCSGTAASSAASSATVTASSSSPASSSSSTSANRNGVRKDNDDEEMSKPSSPPGVFKRPAVPPPSTNKELLNKLIAEAEQDEAKSNSNGTDEVEVKAKRQKIENLVSAADSIDLNKKPEDDKSNGPSASNGGK